MLGAFTGVDHWALLHAMPWLGSGQQSPTVVSVLRPFNVGTPLAQIPVDLWLYPASLPVSALAIAGASVVLRRRGEPRAAAAWATAWVAANAAELIGKTFVPRPGLYDLAKSSEPYFAHAFPSGHTLRGLLVATVVALLWRRARPAAAAWAASSLVLLVVTGAHTPSDVLGGALLAGALIGLTLWYLEPAGAPAGPGARRRL